MFEHGEGLGGVPLAEGEEADSPSRNGKAEGMIDCLSHTNPFFSVGAPRGELSDLGKAPGQPGMGEHGGKSSRAEVTTDQVAFEGGHVRPEEVYRPSIVAQGVVGLAQVESRQDTEGKIVEGRSEGEGT